MIVQYDSSMIEISSMYIDFPDVASHPFVDSKFTALTPSGSKKLCDLYRPYATKLLKRTGNSFNLSLITTL